MYNLYDQINQIKSLQTPFVLGVYFQEYSNRLKCYFQPVPTSVRSGGQTARVFNSGDVIHVKRHRRIEC